MPFTTTAQQQPLKSCLKSSAKAAAPAQPSYQEGFEKFRGVCFNPVVSFNWGEDADLFTAEAAFQLRGQYRLRYLMTRSTLVNRYDVILLEEGSKNLAPTAGDQTGRMDCKAVIDKPQVEDDDDWLLVG